MSIAEASRDVMQTATKSQLDAAPQPVVREESLAEIPLQDSREWQAEQLRLLWARCRFFLRAAAFGLIVSTVAAFSIPKEYTATTQLMPPSTQSASSMATMAALAAKGSGGLGSLAGDLLGLKSSGALFVGVLRSQTSQERLVEQFDLKKVYGTPLVMDARTKLDENSAISEDRKSGILTISVTDRDPRRAAILANAYVDELNSLVANLSTSSARREREFLEERLKVVKQDLDVASNRLAQFSSKNNTLDIQQEGKAMLDVAANLAGQMIAAQAQLEAVRQIYTDSNPRVQSLNAQVGELRKQLDKLSGGNSKPGESPETFPGSSGDMPYPSIRNFPLIGVKYADFYRPAKIQETVYEMLTEQYELAKVEEAKVTPSVKVLDPAKIPERKSFPPRLAIMSLGAFFFLTASVLWVLAGTRWHAVDPADPRKVFFEEVAGTLKARAPWASRNGDGPGPARQRIWNRLGNHRRPESGPADH
jgi:uncharacterized protein involved in exopolysaccharide biosynthesis